MRYLNIGCGAVRPKEPWTNLDRLIDLFDPGTPERKQLESEENYIDHKLGEGPMPFDDATFSVILASHVIEHFDCHAAVSILKDAHRLLVPNGILVVSVPDASYFRLVHNRDTRENAQELFNEPITRDSKETFRSFALFFWQHVQVLTEDSLWEHLVEAGFLPENIERMPENYGGKDEPLAGIYKLLNRQKFSLMMMAKREQ